MADRFVFERHGAVAHLRLNRPERLNAIDPEFCDELVARLESIEGDVTVAAIAISGAGDRAFCSGADLDVVRRLTGPDKRRFVEKAWLSLDRLARSPLPTIAALHGYVLGGGLEFAIACDLRLAEAGTTFGLPEATLGGVPAFGAAQRLPRIVGHGRAVELMMTGRRFDEQEALAIGLLAGATEAGRALEQALALAAALSDRPREATRLLKLSLAAGLDGPAAAAWHGHVSDACHADPLYQSRTSRFART